MFEGDRTLWMSMQGRNRALVLGAAWTLAEHCGALTGQRVICRMPVLACD